MRNLLGVAAMTLAAAVLGGCTVDVAGAPCESDENCPTGQYCNASICELGGNGGTRDAGGGAKDAAGPADTGPARDTGASVDTGTPDDAGTPDAAAADGGADAGGDAGADAGTDAGGDAGADAGTVCATSADCAGALCCSGLCAPATRGCCAEKDCVASAYGTTCLNLTCQCTGDKDCLLDERICDHAAVPPTCTEGCSIDKPCLGGKICCKHTCATGECCENAECKAPDKPTCGPLHVCSRTCGGSGDGPCGPGYVCFNGKCETGECALNTDCAAKYPDKPTCEVNSRVCINECGQTGQGGCGAGFACCGGHCVEGECCLDDECKNNPKGTFCVNHYCAEKCSLDSNCPGMHCCQAGPSQGTCYPGECCDASQCASNGKGPKCLAATHSCGCYADGDCTPQGKICVGNACVTGTCHTSTECTDSDAPICDPATHTCRACAAAGDCINAGKGQICCTNQTGTAKACYSGTCCKDADCTAPNHPICSTAHTCSMCAGNQVCINHNLGQMCCGSGPAAGSCFNGECCNKGPCVNPLKPVCLGNACDECTHSSTSCAEQYGSNYACCASGPFKGSCYAGDCCEDAQCPDMARKFCDTGTSTCVQCLASFHCLPGQVCCGGSCKWGMCCADTDCKLGSTGDGGTNPTPDASAGTTDGSVVVPDGGGGAYGMCYQNHCRIPCGTGCPAPMSCCTTLGFCRQPGETCCKDNAACGVIMETCCYGVCNADPSCKF